MTVERAQEINRLINKHHKLPDSEFWDKLSEQGIKPSDAVEAQEVLEAHRGN